MITLGNLLDHKGENLLTKHNTVAFGDFKNYWIGDRAGRTVQRLNELYATNGQIGYVATERVDGKVILTEGIQLLQMKA